MIVGVFLRYFKTYQGIHFIPLANGERFCGILGNNGVGKSSILEALDSFFNGRSWNYNIQTKKSGVASSSPYIVPVFLVERDRFKHKPDLDAVAKSLSELVLSIDEDQLYAAANRQHLEDFRRLANDVSAVINLEAYYLLPLGLDYQGLPSISIFHSPSALQTLMETKDEGASSQSTESSGLAVLGPLLEDLRNQFEYIYIPREIDSESFTQLETQEIQVLMGETLQEILERTVPPKKIRDINTNLNHFIDNLSTELGQYAYRTATDRQQNLRKNDVYKLIIDAFFNIRKLHKKRGKGWLEIGGLSSGEKQKAIIDVARSLILEHRKKNGDLIVAIDEPESSLHMSSCFDQFESLYEISGACRQVLFTSHWYGFLPVMESGSACVISDEGEEKRFDVIDLARYREQVKQVVRITRGRLPYDIRIKSLSDFVQSVIASMIGPDPYHWIVCEGSSEKVYLSEYLKDLLVECKIRIVPVGGAKEIRRIYKHLAVSYEDLKEEVAGSIFFLMDTDAELVRFDADDQPNMICRRLVNSEVDQSARLVKIGSNPVSPETEIEDCLEARPFCEALQSFSEEFPKLKKILDNVEVDESKNSNFGLDLKKSELVELGEFFDFDDNKMKFAREYSHVVSKSEADRPAWVEEIRSWLGEKCSEGRSGRT